MTEIITDYLDARQLADRLTALELHSTSELARLEKERDDALSQIAQAECRAERFCQERDEAREALMKIEDLFIDGTDIYADRENMGTIARNALKETPETEELKCLSLIEVMAIPQERREIALGTLRAIKERNEAMDYSKATWQSLRDSQDEVLRLTFENREVTQDLDKARDAIMKVEEIFVDGENTHDDWFKMGSIAREYFKK